MQKLREQVAGDCKGVIPLDRWYNYSTFDVIGDFSFGESFHNVERGELHYQIQSIYDALRANNYLRAAQSFPFAVSLFKALIPKSLVQKRINFINWANERATTRMKSGSVRPDFMTYMLRNNLDKDKGGMTEKELQEAAGMYRQYLEHVP